MKADEVRIGDVYAVNVSGQIAPVVIDEQHSNGGWVGTNQETNRQVRIKSARRLRMPWDEYLAGDDGEEADTAPEGAEEPEAKPEAKKPKKRATRAKTGDDGAKMNGRQAEASGEGRRGLSGLEAAAKVLQEADQPLRCKDIVERAFEAGYWRSDGQTPAATVYAAMLREIANKGEESRFVKVGRGLFALSE
jgi:hypothetical protein